MTSHEIACNCCRPDESYLLMFRMTYVNCNRAWMASIYSPDLTHGRLIAAPPSGLRVYHAGADAIQCSAGPQAHGQTAWHLTDAIFMALDHANVMQQAAPDCTSASGLNPAGRAAAVGGTLLRHQGEALDLHLPRPNPQLMRAAPAPTESMPAWSQLTTPVPGIASRGGMRRSQSLPSSGTGWHPAACTASARTSASQISSADSAADASGADSAPHQLSVIKATSAESAAVQPAVSEVAAAESTSAESALSALLQSMSSEEAELASHDPAAFETPASESYAAGAAPDQAKPTVWISNLAFQQKQSSLNSISLLDEPFSTPGSEAMASFDGGMTHAMSHSSATSAPEQAFAIPAVQTHMAAAQGQLSATSSSLEGALKSAKPEHVARAASVPEHATSQAGPGQWMCIEHLLRLGAPLTQAMLERLQHAAAQVQ